MTGDIYEWLGTKPVINARGIYTDLGGSVLAYWLWFYMLKTCGATTASAYHFLMPPLAMLFAFLVLGEHVSLRDLLGVIPVALGIYLVTRPAATAPVLKKEV